MAEAPKRCAFGSRYLEDSSRVFEHNAWDDVEWEEEQRREAEVKVEENSKQPVSEENRVRYDTEAAGYWDAFYQQHHNRFFKDRHWLFTEFPELLNHSREEEEEGQEKGKELSRKKYIWEVGCGAGNTVFPILQARKDAGIFVYCCDFAESAVDLVKEHALYNSERCCAFQCDITSSSSSPPPFPPASIDIITLVFVLSAINPDKMQSALQWLVTFLKPGGVFLFRDYGRYDMAQLRFKKGRCLGDNFYVRGDGTRVYFFTKEEVHDLLTRAGLHQQQLHTDQRLQVNRGRQVKMYRVWIQAKYCKPLAM